MTIILPNLISLPNKLQDEAEIVSKIILAITMNYLAKNLKFLREESGKSQEDISSQFGIKRSTWNAYEREAEPDFDTVIRMAEYFKLTVDQLLKVNLGELSAFQLKQLKEQGRANITGSNLRVLATSVNAENEDNIELVSEKAKAGYTAGYADPDFIKVLPAFTLPFLDRNKKYRTFQISGDSMPPVPHGSYVTTQYVDNWEGIKDKHPYIIITKDEGVVFKMVYNKINESGSLLLCSTNPLYKPYEVKVEEVLEVWKFVNFISSEITVKNTLKSDVAAGLANLQAEVAEIKTMLKKT